MNLSNGVGSRIWSIVRKLRPRQAATARRDVTCARQDGGLVWVINGLPRSGQQQLANRLARTGKAPAAELIPEGGDGYPEWPIDAASADKLKALVHAAAADHSVLYTRVPLLAGAAFNNLVSCHHIHMVRDPRQLFAGYSRRPQQPELVQLARVVATGKHLPQLRPLWDGNFPGLDLLSAPGDDALRQRLAAGTQPLYGVFYYLWVLSLLRNLRLGALCVELRTLATSRDARADLVAFFAAFGLDLALPAGRFDHYAAHDIALDLGLPRAPWGSRLKRRPREAPFAETEARVGRVLEDAADLLDLRIDEEVGAALTRFIDPAYTLVVLPFMRPWFAKSGLTRKPVATKVAERCGARTASTMRGTK